MRRLAPVGSVRTLSSGPPPPSHPRLLMQFIALIYNDPGMLASLPGGQEDEMMRGCIAHADELRREGRLLESRMLAEPKTARSIRICEGRMTVVDGPFAEAKEMLGGFN